MCTSLGTEAQASAVSHRQAPARCAESDSAEPDEPLATPCSGATPAKARSRTGREADRFEIIGEAIAALERAAVVLRAEALLKEWSSLDIRTGINLYQEVRRFETWLIKRALAEAGGSQTRAARLLGINTTTLHEKMKRFGIT